MTKIYQVIAALMLAFVFSAGAQAQAAAASKVGFVDLRRALEATTAGKKVKEQLEKEFKKKKEELDKKGADIKKMDEELTKRAGVMTDEAKSQRQQAIQEEMMKYRDIVNKSQVDFQKKQVEMMNPILKKLQDVIEDVAKKDGYTMVLSLGQQPDIQMVLWATKDSDLTERVIEAFNKKK